MKKLQSLPAMLNTAELNQLLRQFPVNAKITGVEPGSISRVVYAPNGEKVLSATEYRKDLWHVMAVPGMINVKPKDAQS